MRGLPIVLLFRSVLFSTFRQQRVIHLGVIHWAHPDCSLLPVEVSPRAGPASEAEFSGLNPRDSLPTGKVHEPSIKGKLGFPYTPPETLEPSLDINGGELG